MKNSDLSGCLYFTIGLIALCGIIAGLWSLWSNEILSYIERLVFITELIVTATVGIGIALSIGARLLPTPDPVLSGITTQPCP